MITYILLFVVVALLASFMVQDYEGVFFKLEIPGYSVEANMVFVILLTCILVLSLVLIVRACLAFALFVHRLKCKAMSKQYENIGRCYAYLSIGELEDIKQIENIPIKHHGLNHAVLSLLKGCACFRLGQYEVAEKYFTLLPQRDLTDGKFGVWLIRILESEQSRDCRLRVLYRLISVFNTRPWVSLLKLEAARVECRWKDVLEELKFIFKNGVPHPYDLRGLRDIAHYKLAEICYNYGNYREGLGWLRNIDSLQASILTAKFYVKLNNIKKAVAKLEERYKKDPHPEIADLYMAISPDCNTAIEKLHGLVPECYVSTVLAIRKYINLKQYNAAEQHLKRAVEKYRYVQLYCTMLEVMVRLGDLGEITYWIEEMKREAIPDMRWECHSCSMKLDSWHHECWKCGKFASIRWVES